jgi:putative ABC transport system ATP-binding protein
VLARIGLTGREHHTSGELSGGQQQRVAIARAIVTEPVVLLADEPTGNLDTKTSREIMELLTSLNRDQGITIIMVTHEADMAAYANRIVRFLDGRIATDESGRKAA